MNYKKIVFEIFLVVAATLFTCSVFLSFFIHFSLPTDDGEITHQKTKGHTDVVKSSQVESPPPSASL